MSIYEDISQFLRQQIVSMRIKCVDGANLLVRQPKVSGNQGLNVVLWLLLQLTKGFMRVMKVMLDTKNVATRRMMVCLSYRQRMAFRTISDETSE